MKIVGPDTQMVRDPHWDDAWTENNEYVLPHPDNGFEILRAGRASELGKTISNTFTLNMWHQRQIVKGMAMRPRLGMEATIAINDGLTDAEQRKRLLEIAREAKEVAGSKEAAGLGTGFHKLTELHDAGKISEAPEPWTRDLAAYAALLRKVGIVPVPEFTEKIVWERQTNTCGRFDRLVRYLRRGNRWVVLDLKTGRDLSYGMTSEIPVQQWVYANAEQWFEPNPNAPRLGPEDHFPNPLSRSVDVSQFGTWHPMPDVCKEIALILHVPLGTGTATLIELDLTSTIEMPAVATPADLCVAVQKWRKVRKLARPVARIQVTPDGEVLDDVFTWQERYDLANSEAELADIYGQASAVGEVTSWHSRWMRERRDQLAS